MNITDAQELVGRVYAIDGREVTDKIIETWFTAIGHLNSKVADTALKAVMQEQTGRITPAHILAKAKEQLKDKSQRQHEPTPVKGDPQPICIHNKLLLDCVPCCKELAEQSKCRHNLYPTRCETCHSHFQKMRWDDWMKLKQVI